MSDMPQALVAKRDGHLLTLTINRADRRNAMNADVLSGLIAAFDTADADADVRCIVLTGTGDRAFCAGADLAKRSDSFEFDPSRPNSDFADVLRRSKRLNTPLVARVNGHCMAGGMGLLGMCDMAVAADDATFGLPEVKVGLFPMQVLSVLQRTVACRHLAEMSITGEPIDARRACEIGLINYTVPRAELDAKTAWLVSRIVDKSPSAIRRGKYAMHEAESMNFAQSIAYLETQIITLALSEDAREGRAAFQEKRTPNWPGR